jgi:hypothetical protein
MPHPARVRHPAHGNDAMSDEVWNSRLADLATRAAKARAAWEVGEPTRPLFVEFCGTPKSGKSSAIEIVRHFFHRNDFRVLAPAEGASRRTPAYLKGDLVAFNVWSGCYSLSNLLERTYEAGPFDLVLLDRGLFDVTCWMSLLQRRSAITDEERQAIERFFLLPRWRQLTDLVVLVTVQAELALEREHRDRLSMAQGQAMNQATLAEMNEVYPRMAQVLGDQFPNFLELDTSNSQMNLRETSYQIVARVLDRVEQGRPPAPPH